MTARKAQGWHRLLFATLILSSASVARPAAAQGAGAESACAPVLDALQRMGEAARYHWKISATTPARRRPFEREEVVLDDVVYLTPDEGRWMKQRIVRAERAARMADDLARNPVAECRPEGAETRDGGAMLVYAYRQGTADKRIWIGAADGLPHVFTSSEGPVSVTMQVEYERIKAPLP